MNLKIHLQMLNFEKLVLITCRQYEPKDKQTKLMIINVKSIWPKFTKIEIHNNLNVLEHEIWEQI